MFPDIPHKNEPRVKRPIAEANTRRVPNRSRHPPADWDEDRKTKRIACQHRFHAERSDAKGRGDGGYGRIEIVVSSDSMKKATATSQGRRRLAASDGPDAGGINGRAHSWVLGEPVTAYWRHATRVSLRRQLDRGSTLRTDSSRRERSDLGKQRIIYLGVWFET